MTTPAAARVRVLGAMLLLVPVLAALSATLIFPGDPFEPRGAPFLAPSGVHPMGTDDLGRDVLVMVMHGGIASLLTGTLIAGVAICLGVALGVIAGLSDGAVDGVLVRLMDVSQVVPRFFLALLAIAWFGPGWATVVAVLALTSWAPVARQVRTEARALRTASFIDAARLLGRGKTAIAVFHVAPLVIPLALAQVSLIFANSLLIEAGLAFLGAGDPNRLTWGLLLHTAQLHAVRGWWLGVFPGLVLVLATVGLALIAFDSRDRTAHMF